MELALDGDAVVGFVTAASDGVLSAFIPLLEVLPAYRDRGIGAELVRRLLGQLDDLYMVDLCCDADRLRLAPGPETTSTAGSAPIPVWPVHVSTSFGCAERLGGRIALAAEELAGARGVVSPSDEDYEYAAVLR